GAGADVRQQWADGGGRQRESAFGVGGDRVFGGVALAVVVGIDTDHGARIVAGLDGRVSGAARDKAGGGNHTGHGDGRRRGGSLWRCAVVVTAAASGDHRCGGRDRGQA